MLDYPSGITSNYNVHRKSYRTHLLLRFSKSILTPISSPMMFKGRLEVMEPESGMRLMKEAR